MDFHIHDYGAQPTGMLCTQQLQAAIDACFVHGGGRVIVPQGTYLTGCIRLRSNVTLYLRENAVLLGSTDPEDYNTYLDDTLEPISEQERKSYAPTVKPGSSVGRSVQPFSRWNNAIIRAIHAENIAIIGEKGSMINGQNCYDPLGEEGYRGPHGINLWYCENVTLRGYTVKDSANWAHAIQNSRSITAQELTVLGGHDGFDIRTCDNILVENCVFKTGDDCIAGFDNIHVVIRGCLLDSACSMLRFGGTDVLVEDCRGIAPATYGHRYTLSEEEKRNRAEDTASCRRNCLNFFLYYCDDRAAVRQTPGRILIRRSYIKNPDTIFQLPFGHKWCCNRSLSDITFEACTFDGICQPIQATCPPEEPLTLRLINCTVIGRSSCEMIPLFKGNCAAPLLENVSFLGTATDQPPAE